MPDPVYDPYDQTSAEDLMVCSICGATVAWVWTERHTEWHRQIAPKEEPT